MDGISVVRCDTISSMVKIEVLVIGTGATGLCAALALRDAGGEALVIERDRRPMGTTAMSTSLIPGVGSTIQREKNSEDSPERFAADIIAKTKGLVNSGCRHAVWAALFRNHECLVIGDLLTHSLC